MNGDNWDVRKLALITLAAGALITTAAIVWWEMFFTKVVNPLVGPGGSWTSVMQCLWSDGGDCALILRLYRLTGGTPYDPAIFWIGISGMIIGLVLLLTARRA